jgi:GH25 family lysozyme M1 (1,4-beta-N-acetylmuramidase)
MTVQYTYGFDVSRYQENVHWDLVKTAGMDFVFVQVSQYDWVDRQFTTHWSNAKGVLPRGPYHFFRQLTSPQKQVDVFLKALGDDPGELPPILDIEDPNATDPASYIKGARFWLDQVEKKLGRHPIIYTAAWFWNPLKLSLGWASDYPLWVASYPFSQGAPTRTQLTALVNNTANKPPKERYPLMPSTWKTWTFWQFAEHGTLDGNFKLSGALADTDLDVFNGPVEDLLKMATGEVMPLPAPLLNHEPPVKVMTNQNVINAFNWAFSAAYIPKLNSAGLSKIVNDRQAPYSGPPVKDLPQLTDAEKAVLQEKWDAILAKQ